MLKLFWEKSIHCSVEYKYLFGTWCTATCRQRINAMVLLPFIYSPETNISSRPTRSSSFFLLHVVPFLAERWLLIFPAFWGAGRPSPPSPKLIPFPTGPRHRPTVPLPCQEQYLYLIVIKVMAQRIFLEEWNSTLSFKAKSPFMSPSPLSQFLCTVFHRLQRKGLWGGISF